MQRIQVTLTSSQLKNLKASPVVLLAAPGEGKYYVVFHAAADYHFGTAVYTNADPNALDIAEGENGLAALNDNELINAPDGRLYQKAVQSAGGPAITANVQNQPVTIANLSAAELADGDGFLTIILYYEIEDVVA